MAKRPPNTTPVTLFAALARATCTPFTRNDWDGWLGATGNAHMVSWHPDDADAVLDAVELGHVPAEYVTTIVDDTGLSFNLSSPVNGYAWAVNVRLTVDTGDAPLREVYWEVETSRAGRDWPAAPDVTVAGLPQEFQLMYYASPQAARPHVLAGYLQAQRERDAPPLPQQAAITERAPLRMLRWWVRYMRHEGQDLFCVCAEQEEEKAYSVPFAHAQRDAAEAWGLQHLSARYYKHVKEEMGWAQFWRLEGKLGQGAFLMPAGLSVITPANL